MTIINEADENSKTNQEEVELDNTTNEEENSEEILAEETEEDEAELDSEWNEDEEEKPQKKRKSGVPKLLAEKNRQAETIKSMAEKIKAQEQEIKRLKADNADNEEIEDAKLEKKLLEIRFVEQLAEDYPDVDPDEAKKFSKRENVSIHNAFKLLNMEIAEKQGKAKKKSLTGSHYDAWTRVYTEEDLKKMSQEEYNKAMDAIEKWKAKYQ